MKNRLGIKIILIFSSLILTCSSFIGYGIYLQNKQMVDASIVFSVIVSVLFLLELASMKSYFRILLSQLCELIASITSGHQEEVFSVLNDDLVSKLQAQVIKLSGILNKQNEKLKKESDEIKSLISDISHQLKTPLANLKLYCELLQDESLLKEQREQFTNHLDQQTSKLQFLMESMIKMSRLESGIIQINSQNIDLNKVCLSAIKQVYPKAKAKNTEIIFLAQQEILLCCDDKWTTEALFNILDNAVKYTACGNKISITAEKYEMFARVTIRDRGEGIKEDEINHIFKRFYRGENAIQEEGVGIGLYLSREIATLQGGYIKVKSSKEQGTEFSVFLPLE